MGFSIGLGNKNIADPPISIARPIDLVLGEEEIRNNKLEMFSQHRAAPRDDDTLLHNQGLRHLLAEQLEHLSHGL